MSKPLPVAEWPVGPAFVHRTVSPAFTVIAPAENLKSLIVTDVVAAALATGGSAAELESRRRELTAGEADEEAGDADDEAGDADDAAGDADDAAGDADDADGDADDAADGAGRLMTVGVGAAPTSSDRRPSEVAPTSSVTRSPTSRVSAVSKVCSITGVAPQSVS